MAWARSVELVVELICDFGTARCVEGALAAHARQFARAGTGNDAPAALGLSAIMVADRLHDHAARPPVERAFDPLEADEHGRAVRPVAEHPLDRSLADDSALEELRSAHPGESDLTRGLVNGLLAAVGYGERARRAAQASSSPARLSSVRPVSSDPGISRSLWAV